MGKFALYLNPIVCFNMFDILLIDRKETVMSPATCHFYFILFKHYSLHNHCFYFLVYAPTFYFTFRFCLQETRFLCSLFGLSSADNLFHRWWVPWSPICQQCRKWCIFHTQRQVYSNDPSLLHETKN